MFETWTAAIRAPLDRRPGHPQNAGRFDLRLAGGKHPTSFGKPRTHERLRTTAERPGLPYVVASGFDVRIGLTSSAMTSAITSEEHRSGVWIHCFAAP
jgi:hypothetical protein